MEFPTLNIILGKRAERKERLFKELREQGIIDYKLWPGIYLPSVKQSINKAHKQIVEYAYENNLQEIFIAEDDLIFSHPKSWEYYIKNKPLEYDLYLSMIFLGEPDENNLVKDFNGLTLYGVSSRFFPYFLSTPDDDHLDRLLSMINGKFVVCKPFVAKQQNGFSANTGKVENYDHLLRNREFL